MERVNSDSKISFFEKVYTALQAAEEYEIQYIRNKYQEMKIEIDMIMTDLQTRKKYDNNSKKNSKSKIIRDILYDKIKNSKFTFKEISKESGASIALVRKVVERTGGYMRVFQASSKSPAIYQKKIKGF